MKRSTSIEPGQLSLEAQRHNAFLQSDFEGLGYVALEAMSLSIRAEAANDTETLERCRSLIDGVERDRQKLLKGAA